MRGFLQIANTNWNSLWKRWLPNFAWRPVRGGLCGNEDFEQAKAEIQHGKSHDGACPPWIEMLVQGELGRNNACRRAARAFRVSWVPKRCSGIFNVSNAWTNTWNKMIEEKLLKKRGSRGRIPRKDSKE